MNIIMRIKPKDIKIYREQYHKEQNGICPLCQEPIHLTEAVLDHRHSDGYIRGTIHRNCNLYIGKMENNLARNKITRNRLKNILNNFISYIDSNKDVLHPTHLTKEERHEKLARKRLKNRAKQKASKAAKTT